MRSRMAASTLALLAACGGAEAPTGEVAVSEADSAGVTVVTISGERAMLPGVTLSAAPLAVISGDDPPFLGVVGEVAFRSDGSLVVEDNQAAEVTLFSDTGELLRRVGSRGDAPGEFRNVTALSVGAGDTTFTYDRRHSRITVFDPAGELVKIVSLQREFAGRGSIAFDAWAFDSDSYVLHSMAPVESEGVPTGPRLEQRGALLHQLDAEGTAASEPTRFDGGLVTVGQTFDGTSPLGNETIVALGPDVVVFGAGVEYELTVMSVDGRPNRIVRWPGWARPAGDSIVQAARDSMHVRYSANPRADPERIAALLDAIFAPELVPARLPVLGEALVDPLGRMWVSTFAPRTAPWSQEEAWHVLDAAGRPLGKVTLPANTRLAAVGNDRVALVSRDSLDVQHVRVFGVSIGTGR